MATKYCPVCGYEGDEDICPICRAEMLPKEEAKAEAD